jgi:hypothetical protein
MAIILAAVGASVLTFALLVYLDRPDRQSHEYIAIAIWTLPLAFLVLLVTRMTRTFLDRRSMITRWFLAVILAIATSLTWTFLAVWLSGGYTLAFDANPFFCWTVGSLVGFFAALRIARGLPAVAGLSRSAT